MTGEHRPGFEFSCPCWTCRRTRIVFFPLTALLGLFVSLARYLLWITREEQMEGAYRQLLRQGLTPEEARDAVDFFFTYHVPF